MKLLKFILSLETFFCSSCFLAIFSPENQKREWDRTKNWKFLVRSPTPARVLKQLSSCLRLQMKKTKFSPKALFWAWKANEESNHLLRSSFITKSNRSWALLSQLLFLSFHFKCVTLLFIWQKQGQHNPDNRRYQPRNWSLRKWQSID